MEQLLEDYKRKLKTVIEMLNADTLTAETIQRLTIKKGMITSFIFDIERAMADANTGDSGLHLQRVSFELPEGFIPIAEGKPENNSYIDAYTTEKRVLAARYETLLGNDFWEACVGNIAPNETVIGWR